MLNFISLVFLGTAGIIAGIIYGFFKCALSYFKAFNYSFNRKYSLKTKAKLGEPAAEKYFFNKQYEDLSNTYESAKSINSGNILMLKNELNTKSYFTYYRVKTAQKVIYILGNLINVICVSIHFLIVTIISMPIYLFYFIVLCGEKFKFKRGKIGGVCPRCLTRFDIPYYICPKCGRIHKMLTPGPYGIIKRRCKCKEVIPCTNLGGRFKLKAICPVCKGDIESRESSPLCIPVVGPESSGKTSFIYSAINTLRDCISRERKWNIEFLNENCGDKIKKSLESFKKGIPPEKTDNSHTEVYNIFINSSRFFNEKLLYFYDIGGEYFNSRANIRTQRHYKYIEGLIFVIDPLCMARGEKHIKKNESVKSRFRDINIHDFIDRFILALREINQIQPKKLITIPSAIVINKMDLFGYNGPIEDFLREMGEDAIIKKFEYNFASYKFFSCSLFPYEETAAAEVVKWILGETNSEFGFLEKGKHGSVRSV